MSISPDLHDLRLVKDRAVAQASPFVVRFARFGFAAKGVVYCVVGALALTAALGSGGGDSSPNTRDALRAIADRPFGQVLIGIVAIGLAGYAIWQFIRAVEDPEHKGSDAKGIAERLGYFGSGLVHASLVAAAWHLVLRDGRTGNGDDKAHSLTAQAMTWPAGKWIVVAIGLGILGFGLSRLFNAWRAKLSDMLDLSPLGPQGRRAAVMVARIGIAARGVVFAIVGTFLAVAGWRSDPSRAKGIGEAISWVQTLPAGWAWFLAIAAGLVAYGVWMFINARYRRIRAAA